MSTKPSRNSKIIVFSMNVEVREREKKITINFAIQKIFFTTHRKMRRFFLVVIGYGEFIIIQ